MNCERSGKFKLIELLAVVAVLSLLVQLLFPALIAVREEARRTSCKSNLRRLGVAIGRYHQANEELPVAGTWKWDMKPYDVGSGLVHGNWAIELLPYIEQQRLYDSRVSNVPISAPENARFRTTPLSELSCPSDTNNNIENLYNHALTPEVGIHHVGKYARGNYAINGGTQDRCRQPGDPGLPCAKGYERIRLGEQGELGSVFQQWGNGIAGYNKALAFTDIRGGLGKTVALEELRAGLHPVDPRGVWSVGLPGMSVTWAHGVDGDAFGPNNSAANSDDIYACDILRRMVGDDRVVSERMGCCGHCNHGNVQAGARSMHPGGVQVLMCDGASHFIAEGIDASIWYVMHSRKKQLEFEFSL